MADQAMQGAKPSPNPPSPPFKTIIPYPADKGQLEAARALGYSVLPYSPLIPLESSGYIVIDIVMVFGETYVGFHGARGSALSFVKPEAEFRKHLIECCSNNSKMCILFFENNKLQVVGEGLNRFNKDPFLSGARLGFFFSMLEQSKTGELTDIHGMVLSLKELFASFT